MRRVDQRTERILEWLLGEGRLLKSPGELLAHFCGELEAVGLSVFRANTRIPTLHPEVSVAVYIWHRDPVAKKQLGATKAWLVAENTDPLATGEVTESLLAHGVAEGDAFLRSPIYEVTRSERPVHEVISPDQTSFRFPIVADLHELGATAYLALPMRLSSGLLSAASFVTDTPGGFSPEDLALLETTAKALAMCLEILSANHVRRSLLKTYLGAGPGELVQSGRVRPGDVQRLEAAIAFSDIRGFSDLSAMRCSSCFLSPSSEVQARRV